MYELAPLSSSEVQAAATDEEDPATEEEAPATEEAPAEENVSNDDDKDK